MQFVIIGRDGTDAGAPARRLAARPAHIELGNKLREEGTMLYGVALLNDEQEMVGSLVVIECRDEQAVSRYLEIEPYVVQNVWESVEITPCRVGPSFANLKPDVS